MHILLLEDTTDLNSTPKSILHTLRKEIEAIKGALVGICAKPVTLSIFDAHGGDCGCQFRASMVAKLVNSLSDTAYSYLGEKLQKAHLICQGIRCFENKQGMFFYGPSVQIKQERKQNSNLKLTVNYVLKYHHLCFEEDDNPYWNDLCFLAISYYLCRCKDKNGLKCIFDKDKVLVKFMQKYITAKSVQHVEDLAGISFSNVTFEDKCHRKVMPIRLAFDHLWHFWSNQFPIFFRITKFGKDVISFHYLTLHNFEISDERALNEFDENSPVILIDCISGGSIQHIENMRQHDTCLGFDTSKFEKVQDKDMDNRLHSLSFNQLTNMMELFFASHPQLINAEFSNANKERMEEEIPGFLNQLETETSKANELGCSKHNCSFFAPEHIYCESVYGIKRRFGLYY